MVCQSDFMGRIAVVTGGSYGLGFDFCRGLLELGCVVYFCGRSSEHGRHAAESLGQNAHFVRADLADPCDVQAFVDEVLKNTDKIDYLVNNIATDARIEFDDVDLESSDRMWATNLRSYILTTRGFVDALRAGAGKAIVNIGTTNYMFGKTPFTLYNATKCGIVGFTRSLARELGADGIRANIISPGWVMTEKQLREHVTDADKSQLMIDQALKFLLKPEHITPSVLFLLSSGAAAITGQELVVDAGEFVH